MKHVHGERVETCDIHAAREGPHYAVGALSLFLIRDRQTKKDGVSFRGLTGNLWSPSAADEQRAHVLTSQTGFKPPAPHLLVELDLVLQDDPVRSVWLLP